MQLFEGIVGKYPNLFKGGQGEPNAFVKKWGWITTINSLAGGDKTKWDYFYEMNVIQFLNLVCFQIDEAENENRL